MAFWCKLERVAARASGQDEAKISYRTGSSHAGYPAGVTAFLRGPVGPKLGAEPGPTPALAKERGAAFEWTPISLGSHLPGSLGCSLAARFRRTTLSRPISIAS